MTARVLERGEWDKLLNTEAAPTLPFLTDQARVVVLEDGDQIIACQVLQPLLHAEGLWIHPDHRGRGGVLRRLWLAVQQEVLNHFGLHHFITTAKSDEVKRIVDRLGAVQLLVDHYVVPIGAKSHRVIPEGAEVWPPS